MKNFQIELKTEWKYYSELIQIKNKMNDMIDYINELENRIKKLEK